MSKNYMEQVARMLGVEMGEKFKIKSFEQYKFYINENGLQSETSGLLLFVPDYFSDLIAGKYEIVKIPKRKHTGLEAVQKDEWIYPMFDVVNCMKISKERDLTTCEFSDRKIRNNWERYIAIKKRLAKAASELNTEPIDWINNAQAKWSIYYNNDNSNLELCYGNTCPTDKIYFTSKEAAQKAIEIVGKGDLIWMLRDFQAFIGYSTEVKE